MGVPKVVRIGGKSFSGEACAFDEVLGGGRCVAGVEAAGEDLYAGDVVGWDGEEPRAGLCVVVGSCVVLGCCDAG